MYSVSVYHCKTQQRRRKWCPPILVQEIKIKMSWKSLPVASRIVFCFISTLPPFQFLVKHCVWGSERSRVQPLEKSTAWFLWDGDGRVPWRSPCGESSGNETQEPRRRQADGPIQGANVGIKLLRTSGLLVLCSPLGDGDHKWSGSHSPLSLVYFQARRSYQARHHLTKGRHR